MTQEGTQVLTFSAVVIHSMLLKFITHLSSIPATIILGKVNETQKSIEWDESKKLGRGTKPKISAKEDGTVVIIKEESYVRNGINYHAGRVNVDDRIIEGIKECKQIAQIMGVQPDITINKNNHVIVVWHNGQTSLEYKTGILRADASVVEWGESRNYDAGTDPTVSIDNNDNVVSD